MGAHIGVFCRTKASKAYGVGRHSRDGSFLARSLLMLVQMATRAQVTAISGRR